MFNMSHFISQIMPLGIQITRVTFARNAVDVKIQLMLFIFTLQDTFGSFQVRIVLWMNISLHSPQKIRKIKSDFSFRKQKLQLNLAVAVPAWCMLHLFNQRFYQKFNLNKPCIYKLVCSILFCSSLSFLGDPAKQEAPQEETVFICSAVRSSVMI